jgi:hypothetical protein
MPLTLPEFLNLLSLCAPLVAQHPTLRDLAVAQAKVESGFNPAAISPPDGDGLPSYGLMQIHPPNFPRVNLLSSNEALDGCKNLAAYQTFLTLESRYNTGSPTRGFDNGYVEKVETARVGVKLTKLPAPVAPLPECPTTGEHIAWLSCRLADSPSHASYSLNERPLR